MFAYLFCIWLSLSLIKEIFNLQLLSLNIKRLATSLVIFYYLILIYLNWDSHPLFIIAPCFFIIALFLFLKKQEEKHLFSQLCSLLIPLESKMKSSLSFIHAWQEALKQSEPGKIKNKIKEFTEILKFKTSIHYPENKQVEQLMRELLTIKHSPLPLKRLRYLKRKIRVELTFYTKSQRALLQIRSQSFILCLFYFSLLIGTCIFQNQRNIVLILISLILFTIGLIWILQTGRSMKWSV